MPVTPTRPWRSPRRLADGARRRAAALPRPLVALVVVGLLHGTAWAVVTAPLQGPDEITHVAYAQYLAETGKGPNRVSGNGSVSSELSIAMTELNLSPILGHLDARPFWGQVGAVERKLDALPANARSNGPGPNAAGNYPPLYYAYEAVAYRLSPDQGLLGRLFAMRLANVALFAVVIVLSWLVAAELFASSMARTLTTALVALHPKMGSTAGIVNPDMLVVVFSTWVLLLGLRTARAGPAPARVIWLMAAVGGGLLTHPRLLFLPVVAAAALLIGILRTRPERRSLLRGLLAGGAVLVACGLVSVLWTRGHSTGAAYGTSAPASALNPRQFFSYLWQFYLPGLPRHGAPRSSRTMAIARSSSRPTSGSSRRFEVELPPDHATTPSRSPRRSASWPRTPPSSRAGTSSSAVGPRCSCREIAFCVSGMALLRYVSYDSLRGAASDPVLTGRYLLAGISPLRRRRRMGRRLAAAARRAPSSPR